MRVLLLVNSSASSVTARARLVIGKALAADHDVTVADTSRRGHATRLAGQAALDGADVVVVLGGDGTLNEAANGLAGSSTALAALPGGSTNVFARTLGLNDDPVEATGALLDALASKAIRRIGLGKVNDRYFLFHTGMGFDAAVVAQVEKRAALKRYASHPLFVYSAFDTAFRHYDRSRPRFAVHVPGEPVVDDGYLAVCFNSNPYSYLGPMALNFAPDAGFDRGMVMLTIRTLRVPTILRLVGSALGRGRLIQHHPLVNYSPGLDGVRVVGYGPFPYQVDGDYLGETDELVFSHVPDALDVVMP